MRSIKFYLILLFAICTFAVNAQTPQGYPANYANGPRFKALVYYTQHAEEAHYQFSLQAVEFFKKLNYGDGFVLDITMDLSQYSYEQLKEYSVVVMLDGYPNTKAERDAFEKYMENGGGWVGFHVAAYNDKHTNWPWFVDFLGGGVFYCNNWPPQPVLLSISPKNYPLGIKDVVNFGDFPIVWTNTKYRMIYLNMGHGDEEFIDATQNLLFVNAFRWVVSTDKKGDPFKK